MKTQIRGSSLGDDTAEAWWESLLGLTEEGLGHSRKDVGLSLGPVLQLGRSDLKQMSLRMLRIERRPDTVRRN